MTNTSISHGRLAQLVAAGEELTGATVPVLLIRPRSKRPIPSPSGSWWTITDPDDVESAVKEALAHHHDLNLALLAGRNKESPVLVVDVDGPSGVDQGKRLGLHRGLDCWIQQTGRGGVRCQFVFYQEPDLELKRTIEADDLPLDLITNGYCLVPPSRTVGPYRWFLGHSPADIPVSELCSPPSALLDWWLSLNNERQATPPTCGPNAAYRLLEGPIPEGRRNDTLCRIAGGLRLYLPEPVVVALLAAINDARCVPPLPQGEIEAIARSVFKYPQPGVNGHPRALVNPWRRPQSGG